MHDDRLVVRPSSQAPRRSTRSCRRGATLVLTAAAVTPGTLAMPRSSSSKKSSAARGIRILALGQRHPERQHAVRLEAEPDPADREHAPDHQARADHQHDRQRDGADDQTLAQQRLRAAARHAAAAAAKRVHQIPRARMKSRRQTEDQAGRRRHPSVNSSTGRLTATSDSSGIVFGGTSVRITRSAP